MNKPSPNPRRLWQLSPDEDSSRLAPLFRNARASVEGEMPRLHWRIAHTLRARATRPRRVFRLALTVGLVFAAGGSVTAALHPYWHRRTVVEPPRLEPATKTAREPIRRRAVAALTPPTPEALGQAPAPGMTEPATESAPQARTAVVRRFHRAVAPPSLGPAAPVPALQPALMPPPEAPVPSPAPVAAPPPAAPPAPSPIAIEQALLGGAVKALRKQNDPQTALAMLDEHARRFPHSMLGQEAAMLRAEALLGAGRNDEALSVMDRLPLGTLPNRAERLVLRGELRAAVGRWRDARADFEGVLSDAAGGGKDVSERALWGRASARSRQGDEPGARADLTTYLRTFPTGRFALQAAAALKGSR